MLLSLDIKDSKAEVFLEFLKNLDFVKINQSELSEDKHNQLIKERLAEYEARPQDTVELNVVLKKLKVKYDL